LLFLYGDIPEDKINFLRTDISLVKFKYEEIAELPDETRRTQEETGKPQV
jgi:hypothetical protein